MFALFLRLGLADMAAEDWVWNEELFASVPTHEPTLEADTLKSQMMDASFRELLEAELAETQQPAHDPTATPTFDPTSATPETPSPTPEGSSEFNPNGRIPTCPPKTRKGYLKNNSKKFLTCTNESCRWTKFDPNASQLFQQVPAHDRPDEKWSMFKVYTSAGAVTGQCLNQFKNQAGQHKLRIGSCDIWTSRRWMLCSGFLHANMWKCVQSNASIGKCIQSHEKVSLVLPKCIPGPSTILGLKCKSPVTGGGCATTSFKDGSLKAAHSKDVCDACDAAPGSSQSCGFSFSKTTQSTVTNTWASSFTWKVGASFSVTEDFIVGSATQSFSFSFAQTLTTGKSKSISTTVNDNLACSVVIEPGTKESAIANFLVGEINADFEATVLQTWICNIGKNKTRTHSDVATITISNVPTQSIIGSCQTRQESCNPKTMTDSPTNANGAWPTDQPTVGFTDSPTRANGGYPTEQPTAKSHKTASPVVNRLANRTRFE